MDKERKIRVLSVALVATVMMLAVILSFALFGGVPLENDPEETARKSLADLLLDDLFSPEIYPETLEEDSAEEETEPDDPTDTETEFTTADGDGEPDEVPVEIFMNGDLGNSSGMDEQTVVLRLFGDSDERVYLKMQSFGDYTGQGFAPAQAYGKVINRASMDFLPSVMMDSNTKQYFLEITPVLTVSVLPYYADKREGELPTSDVLVTGNDSGTHSVYYLDKGRIASKNSYVLKSLEKEYRAFVRGQYLTIDRTSKQYMQGIIRREGFDPDDPKIVSKVAAFIRRSAVYTKEYDPAMDQEDNIAVAFLDKYRAGVCRHYAAAATLLFRALGIPARYTVGFAAQMTPYTEIEVTAASAHAWVEVYVDGFGWQYVEVTGSMPYNEEDYGDGGESETKPDTPEELFHIKLRPAARSKQYDGTPLIHDGELEGFEEFAAMGYTYKAEVVYDPILIGRTLASIGTVAVYDSQGKDATHRFKIETLQNHISIYYDKLSFASVGYTKIYDDRPLVLSDTRLHDEYIDVYLTSGNLPDGMTWEMASSVSQTAVGRRSASFTVTLYQDGEDVTDYYFISYQYGILEVTSAPLTLTAGSAEKRYDGTPLTEPGITSIGLIEGHYIAELIVTGSQTGIGRSANVISHVLIRNQAGEDVTANYAIELVDGVLRVRP